MSEKENKNTSPYPNAVSAAKLTYMAIVHTDASLAKTIKERDITAFAMQAAKIYGDDNIDALFLIAALSFQLIEKNGRFKPLKIKDTPQILAARKVLENADNIGDGLFYKIAQQRIERILNDENIDGHDIAHIARDQGLDAFLEYLNAPERKISQNRLDGALLVCARYGLNDAIQELHKRGASLNCCLPHDGDVSALQIAAIYDQASTVDCLLSLGSDITALNGKNANAVSFAAHGRAEEAMLVLFKHLLRNHKSIENKGIFLDLFHYAVKYRMTRVRDSMIKTSPRFMEFLMASAPKKAQLIGQAAIDVNDLTAFEYAYETSIVFVDPVPESNLLGYAIACGANEIVDYMVDVDYPRMNHPIAFDDAPPLEEGAVHEQMSIEHLAYAVSNWSALSSLMPKKNSLHETLMNSSNKELATQLHNAQTVWKTIYPDDSEGPVFGSFYAENAKEFIELINPKTYRTIMNLMYKTGFETGTGSELARTVFLIAALFQDEHKLLQYINKWVKPTIDPVIALISHFPYDHVQKGHIDYPSWGNAILKCGPAMSKLLRYAHLIDGPKKSADGKNWSVKETTKAIAQKFYKSNYDRNPEMAALCLEHKIPPSHFGMLLSKIENAPKVKTLPEITIDGKKFGMSGAKFKKMANDDWRALFVGNMIDCCQSITFDHAKSCAYHSLEDENGAVYIVEKDDGDILGCTWAWRNEQNDIVFDSLETLGKRVTPQQWIEILRETSRELNANKSQHKISRLLVGLAGGTPKPALLEEFNAAVEDPAKPSNYNGFWEAKKQVLVWSRAHSNHIEGIRRRQEMLRVKQANKRKEMARAYRVRKLHTQ